MPKPPASSQIKSKAAMAAAEQANSKGKKPKEIDPVTGKEKECTIF